MSRKKLLILIIICIVIIIPAIISVPLIIDSQKTATLNLFVVPEQSKILINGEEYKNGNYKFFPGEVEISISKEGFETKSFKTNLEANKTTLIYKLLKCADTSLFCYLDEENNSDFNLIPYIAHYSENEEIVLDFYTKASIKNLLPINYEAYDNTQNILYWFSITYKTINNQIILMINDNSGTSKNLAYQIIKESGFQINDYKIEYNNQSDSMMGNKK